MPQHPRVIGAGPQHRAAPSQSEGCLVRAARTAPRALLLPPDRPLCGSLGLRLTCHRRPRAPADSACRWLSDSSPRRRAPAPPAHLSCHLSRSEARSWAHTRLGAPVPRPPAQARAALEGPWQRPPSRPPALGTLPGSSPGQKSRDKAPRPTSRGFSASRRWTRTTCSHAPRDVISPRIGNLGGKGEVVVNRGRVSVLLEEKSRGDGGGRRGFSHSSVNPLHGPEPHTYKWLQWYVSCYV